MSSDELELIGGIIAALLVICVIGAWGMAWIQGRSRGPRSGGLDAGRQVELLSNQNARLEGQIGRLEERIATLERIVTDPAERTAREIEGLR